MWYRAFFREYLENIQYILYNSNISDQRYITGGIGASEVKG